MPSRVGLNKETTTYCVFITVGFPVCTYYQITMALIHSCDSVRSDNFQCHIRTKGILESDHKQTIKINFERHYRKI